jgi:hypothetical protein
VRTLRLTPEQVQAHQARLRRAATGIVAKDQNGKTTIDRPTPAGRSKYGNERCVSSDGEKFQSKKEMRRWEYLKMQEHAGVIVRGSLQRHEKFPLKVERVLVCVYESDFSYVQGGKRVVEDVKGLRKGVAYQMFRIKAALMRALHNINVVEV